MVKEFLALLDDGVASRSAPRQNLTLDQSGGRRMGHDWYGVYVSCFGLLQLRTVQADLREQV
jgi:hypothetical protein